MTNTTQIDLQAPYLLFTADVEQTGFAKTALGIAKWCPGQVAGQLRFEGNKLDLGVPDMTVQQAAQAGIKSLVVGVAPVGGTIDERWLAVLKEAAQAGLDLVNGLHTPLESFPEIVLAARTSGSALINVRRPPSSIPVGNGAKRSGKRVLTVGTDCAVGKKYTALALTESLQRLGMKATFRASGQTGIMIAGQGIPIDAVVSDFVSGAAELISPANEPDHWDVIEGQGSLFNPCYAGVSLGLLHGSQPDAIVVCHDASRKAVIGAPQLALPGITECIALNIECGRLTNPDILCAGVSVNTSGLATEERQSYLDSLSEETGLPCVDSVIDGCDAIAELIRKTTQNATEQMGNTYTGAIL